VPPGKSAPGQKTPGEKVPSGDIFCCSGSRQLNHSSLILCPSFSTRCSFCPSISSPTFSCPAFSVAPPETRNSAKLTDQHGSYIRIFCSLLSIHLRHILPTSNTDVFVDSARSLGVDYFLSLSVCLSVCLYLRLSVCHAAPSNRFFFFVSRWNRTIFGRQNSMWHSIKLFSSIFDLGRNPKLYSPKFACRSLSQS